MKTLFKSTNKPLFSIAIFLSIFGLLLLFLNIKILASAIEMIGYGLLVIGAILLFFFFMNRKDNYIGTLLLSLTSFIVGYFFARHSNAMLSMTSTWIGILLLINGILHARTALFYKDYQYPQWKKSLFYSLGVLVVGTLFILRPISSLKWVLRLGGFVLLIEGFAIGISTYGFSKHVKNIDYIEGEFIEKEETK